MNILIVGLPGTGKTTLCRNLANETGFEYINDFYLFDMFGISFLSEEEIFNYNCFELLFSFLSHSDKKNYIFDFNYGISIESIFNLYNKGDFIIYYLGFADVDTHVLLSKFIEKNGTHNLAYESKRIAKFIYLSNIYKEKCKNLNIPFISINHEKSAIIQKLQNSIIKILKSK